MIFKIDGRAPRRYTQQSTPTTDCTQFMYTTFAFLQQPPWVDFKKNGIMPKKIVYN